MVMSVVRFFHPVANSTIVLPTGVVKTFFGGYMDLDEQEEAAAVEVLQELADKGIAGLSIVKDRATAPKELGKAAEQVKGNAAKVAAALGGVAAQE
jgi:hypothetical protein